MGAPPGKMNPPAFAVVFDRRAFESFAHTVRSWRAR